jgi:hypothetical protein
MEVLALQPATVQQKNAFEISCLRGKIELLMDSIRFFPTLFIFVAPAVACCCWYHHMCHSKSNTIKAHYNSPLCSHRTAGINLMSRLLDIAQKEWRWFDLMKFVCIKARSVLNPADITSFACGLSNPLVSAVRCSCPQGKPFCQ